jgi:stress response protein SCP2
LTTPPLRPGQNVPLPPAAGYTIVVTHDEGPEVDLTGFALTAAGTVTGDGDMVFYNQPTSPGAPGVRWLPPQTAGGICRLRLVVDPAAWPPHVVTVRVGLTVNAGTFGAVRNLGAAVTGGDGTHLAALDLGSPTVQNALIVGEIYRHGGAVKVRCVGAGFTDGLRGLATDAGIEVEAEDTAEASAGSEAGAGAGAGAGGAAGAGVGVDGPASRARQLSLVKPGAGAPAVDLRKYEVAVSLVKNKLDGATFRVVLAIDCSGSTKHLFRSGVMQRSLERMVAIADLLDDNGELEVWFFGDFAVRSAAVTVRDMYDYLDRCAADKKRAEGGNFEPRVMKEIIEWTRAEPSPYPTLVLFWSDGGVHAERQITELLVKSSRLPVYWMFLGLGRADYGVLARLDDVRGGAVDNAGFLPIDDIDGTSDESLYGEIFGSFVSRWYAEATAAGILQPR